MKLILSLLFFTSVVLLNARQIQFSPCTKEEPGVECAQISVPQNRSKPGSALMALPVKVYRATGESHGAVFWFSGGPGQTNMDYVPPAELRALYDVVMVGYRGVDGPVVLACPEIRKALKGQGKNLHSKASHEAIIKSSTVCADRLTSEGIDLEGFTMLEVIEDMEYVRKQLGHERIHLLAGSYGTRLSQYYMHLYPDAIKSAVLIGAGVPGGFVWLEEVIARQLDDLNLLCQADPACSTRTSDLRATINEVLDKMPNRWLMIPLNQGKVRTTTAGMLYHAQTASQVVDAYLAAAEGDYAGLALLSLAYDFMVPDMMVWGDFFSKGMIDYDPTVNYYESMEVEKSGTLGTPISALFMDACSTWPVQPAPIDESGIMPHPVLILNGSLDFSTPIGRIREELMPLLPNGQLVEFQGLGHVSDLLYRQEVKTALAEFYSTGKTSLEPEAEAFNFEVGFGFHKITKLSLAVLLLVLSLFFWLAYRLVKRARKSKRPTF